MALPGEPCRVLGDAARLEQAFDNLVNNASEHTGPSGHIWLSAENIRAGDQPAQVVVRVRDDGIGRPVEGAGLALVHRIVTQHGGRVTVESGGENRGSEFIVSLPAVVDDASGRRILIVDDNVDAANGLAELLRLRGHEVRLAYTGAAALEAVGPFLPHFILLDIVMPEMDGYEVARQLRQRPELDDAVVVALTGFVRDADRQLARDAGFDEQAAKPIDLDALAQLLKGSRKA